MAGLSGRGWTCRLCLVHGSGHDVDRYLKRHPWKDPMAVFNPTGSREGRIRELGAAIDGCRADVVVSVNLVDVYESVRRGRVRQAGCFPKVVMALHGLESCLLEDIRIHADVIDAVIATNRLSVAIANASIVGAERVHYAAYGVPSVLSNHSPKLTGSVLRLLYAGRVEQEQKRVLDLPLIVQGLQERGFDARLSVAGVGPLEPQLREAVESSGIGAAVDWLGDLDAASLARAYRSHDALLITSEWETGPIVAWEAMSHGLPVVSSRYVGSGLEGALVDGETALLFDVGDIDGAVRAVARLHNADLRRSVIAGGHALVSSRYSREASVSGWDRALTSVMSAPALPATAPRLSAPSGRLDRWVGVVRAEDLRRLFRIRYVPDSPGSAWPHTGSSSSDQLEFLKRARLLDRQSGSSL